MKITKKKGGCGCGKRGFTLIELLIVIAIIGLLATLAIVSLTTAQRKARDTKRVADMSTLQKSIELYYSDNAAYPTSIATYTALNTALASYITAVPTPPNTTPYYYLVDTGGSSYVVGTTLEDSSHQGLDQDDDTNFSTGYSGVSWTTSSSSSAATALNCADPVYCLVP